MKKEYSLEEEKILISNRDEEEEKLKYYKQSLKEKLHDGDLEDIDILYNNIALSLHRLGRNEKALYYYQQSLEVMLQRHKGNHPDIAETYNSMGNILDSLGRDEEALSYYQQSLKMKIKLNMKLELYDNDYLDIDYLYNKIGSILELLGRDEEALSYYQQSLRVILQIYGDSQEVVDLYNSIGDILKSLGRDEEASYHDKQGSEMLSRILSAEEKSIDQLVEEYEEKCQKDTDNRTYKCNLARYYHVKALDKGIKEDEKEHWLSMSRALFEKMIEIPTDTLTSSTYAEYGMFLMKYHNVEDKEEFQNIEKMLQKGIELGFDKSGLSYGKKEKEIAIKPLQTLIESQDEISIRPIVLAYYLLVKLYHMHNMHKESLEVLNSFKKIISEENDKIEKHLYKAVMAECFPNLSKLEDRKTEEKEMSL